MFLNEKCQSIDPSEKISPVAESEFDERMVIF